MLPVQAGLPLLFLVRGVAVAVSATDNLPLVEVELFLLDVAEVFLPVEV